MICWFWTLVSAPSKTFLQIHQLDCGGKLSQGDLIKAKERYTPVTKSQLIVVQLSSSTSSSVSSTSLLESDNSSDDDDDDVVLLDDWDQWMNPNDADVDESDSESDTQSDEVAD